MRVAFLSRGLGWRIYESVEDTKLSTNKQHTLSFVQIETSVSVRAHGRQYIQAQTVQLAVILHTPI